MPIVSDQHAFARDRGESFDIGVIGIEKHIAFFVIFHAHAVVVENFGEALAQKGIGIGSAHFFDHAFGCFAIKGVELQQTVAPFLHF